MRSIMVAAAIYSVLISSQAHAQAGAPSAPSAQPSISATPNDFAETSLDRQTNYRRLDGDVAGTTRTLRQFPAKPKDIVQGKSVRDADGFLVGTVAKVDSGFAVVAGTVGSVEVDFASFAKNKNGLLINLPKAKLDAMMAHGKPAG